MSLIEEISIESISLPKNELTYVSEVISFKNQVYDTIFQKSLLAFIYNNNIEIWFGTHKIIQTKYMNKQININGTFNCYKYDFKYTFHIYTLKEGYNHKLNLFGNIKID